MNKVFRIVWSQGLDTLVVASELASASGSVSARLDLGAKPAEKGLVLRAMMASLALAGIGATACCQEVAKVRRYTWPRVPKGHHFSLSGKHVRTLCASLLLFGVAGISLPAQATNLNVLFYSPSTPTAGFKNFYGLGTPGTGDSSSTTWTITQWVPGQAQPTGIYNVLVVGSDAYNFSTLNSTYGTSLASASRVFITGQDADYHVTYGPGPTNFNGPRGFLRDAINWAGASTSLSPVFLTTQTSELTALGFTGLGATGFGSNTTTIPGTYATYPINTGLTSAGLSSWNTSSHLDWTGIDTSKWTGINTDPAGAYVTLVSAATAGSGGSGVPTPPIVTVTNIDAAQPSYLAAGLVAGTLNPLFDGGVLKLDGTALGSNYTFKITAKNGTVDLAGLSAMIATAIADATTGSPGGLTVSNSGSGGALTLTAVNTYTGGTTIDTGATLALTGAGSIASSSGVTDNGSFDISGASGNESITTLSGNGNVALGANSLSLTNGSGTFAGVIGGSGGLALNGGTEVVSGANTYSGGTSLNGGTLQVSADNNLGASSGALNFNGGTLEITATFTTTRNIAMTGPANFNTDAGTVLTDTAGTITGTGPINKSGTGTLILGVDGSTGGVNVNAGNLTLTGASTDTGATGIASGATLALTGAGSIASSSGVTDNGSFDISGASGNESIATLSGNGNVALGANSLSLTNASGTFAGVIGGSGGLALNGGTEVLSGANTYSGGTSLSGNASLSIGAGASLGSGGLAVGAGSSVAFNNAAQTLGDLSGAGNIVLNGTALNTNGDSLSTSYSGVLSGTGSLTKSGNGTLTLSGANTYAGGTTLSGGSQVNAIAPLNSVLLTTADLVDGAKIAVGNATASVNTSTVSIGAANNLGAGALTFNGGTLQTSAGLTAATAMAVDAGNGAIDNSGNAVVLSGDITGAGGLTFLGAGTTTLTGANSFAGGATLAGGTVAIGAAANLGAGNLAFNGNGTIDNGGHAATFSGVVSGPGSMSYTGVGTTTLSGSNTYAGGSNLLGGTVSIAAPGNLGSGAINFNGGTLLTTSAMTVGTPITVGSNNGTIDNGGNGDTFTGNISGFGALTFAGSGATTITGTANNAGSLLVNPGSTLLMGIPGSQLTVSSASNTGAMQLASGASLVASNGLVNTGMLYGTGGVLTGNLNNLSGTVSVNPALVTASGAGIAPQTTTTVATTPAFANFGQAAVSSVSAVNGDFTQGANGALDFSITPTTNTQLQVSGNIQLAGALAVQASTGHYLRTTYALINDANPNATLTGQFSSVAVSGLPHQWGYNITYVTDPQVLLSVFPLTAFSSAGNPSGGPSAIPNVASAGAALDAAVPTASGVLYAQLNTLYQLPTTQLAAALQQLDGEMYADAAGVLSHAVDDSWHPVYTRMGLSATQHGSLPETAQHVWISGLGSVGHTGSDGNADGIRQDMSGFLLGADRSWGRWNMGVTTGSVHAGATRGASADSRLSATMWQVGGYASTTFGSGGRVGLLLGYTDGPVNFANASVLGTATGSATAQVFSAQTRASWTKELGGGNSITPIASINATTVHLGGVSEMGTGPMGLVVPTQDTSTVDGRLQIRFDHTWNLRGMEWTASTALGLRQMLVQPDGDLMVSYAGIAGQGFTVNGLRANKTAGLLDLGLTAYLNTAMSLEFGYRGTYGSRTRENALQAKVVVKF